MTFRIELMAGPKKHRVREQEEAAHMIALDLLEQFGEPVKVRRSWSPVGAATVYTPTERGFLIEMRSAR